VIDGYGPQTRRVADAGCGAHSQQRSTEVVVPHVVEGERSRVKRYLTPRENARFACKLTTSNSNVRIRVLRSLRVFHGSSGHRSPPVAHSAAADLAFADPERSGAWLHLASVTQPAHALD
jgi:hypothetical protein